MSFFGAGKKISTPAIQQTAPVPTEGGADVTRKGEDTRRKMLARLGREGTILTALGGQQQFLGTSL